MQGISNRKLWAVMLAVGALGLLAVVGFTGRATAHHAQARGGNAEIEMKLKGKNLFFSGSPSVQKGKKLKIVNKTNPKQVGPHTFSIVRKADLPRTKTQQKKCEKLQLKVCKNIFKAHKVGPPPAFPIGKQTVEKGKKGWDKEFTKRKLGDSWVAEKKNEAQSRRVSARAGRTLYYLCIVHPNMQGKIKVTR